MDCRCECLCGKALAPGIPGQNVTRHRFMRCLKPETRASKQLAVGTRYDQIGSGRPLFPLLCAEPQECLRVLHGAVAWPAHKPGDFIITRVTLENFDSIAHYRLPQNQPRRFELGRSLHMPS